MCPSVQPGRSLHSADTGGKQQWPLATVPVSPRQLPSCNDPVENVQPYFKMKSHFSQYFSGPMGREIWPAFRWSFTESCTESHTKKGTVSPLYNACLQSHSLPSRGVPGNSPSHSQWYAYPGSSSS